jgi:predicted DNA-binding protein (UPF0251 family)
VSRITKKIRRACLMSNALTKFETEIYSGKEIKKRLIDHDDLNQRKLSKVMDVSEQFMTKVLSEAVNGELLRLKITLYFKQLAS